MDLIVVSSRTVVPHLETTKDVMRISAPYDLLSFVFLTYSSRSLFFFSTWWITCIYLSRMDEIFKIHSVLGTSRPLFRLIAPTRGRFGPRLPSPSLVNGCE